MVWVQLQDSETKHTQVETSVQQEKQQQKNLRDPFTIPPPKCSTLKIKLLGSLITLLVVITSVSKAILNKYISQMLFHVQKKWPQKMISCLDGTHNLRISLTASAQANMRRQQQFVSKLGQNKKNYHKKTRRDHVNSASFWTVWISEGNNGGVLKIDYQTVSLQTCQENWKRSFYFISLRSQHSGRSNRNKR